MEAIERDHREYTLDDEDMKVQNVILNRDPSVKDTVVLKKTLSCSYPNLPFNEAIKKENEKLQLELQRSQANLDISQCEVIQHLLDVTEVVASTSLPESPPRKPTKEVARSYSDASGGDGHFDDEKYHKNSEKQAPSRLVLPSSNVQFSYLW